MEIFSLLLKTFINYLQQLFNERSTELAHLARFVRNLFFLIRIFCYILICELEQTAPTFLIQM